MEQQAQEERNARSNREASLTRASRLEYLTVAWNIVEGVVAVTAALAAGSVALLAFGLDSFVESSSGLILIWRLSKERRDVGSSNEEIERLDQRAHRLVGVTLVLLAVYIVGDSVAALWNHEQPELSLIHISEPTRPY